MCEKQVITEQHNCQEGSHQKRKEGSLCPQLVQGTWLRELRHTAAGTGLTLNLAWAHPAAPTAPAARGFSHWGMSFHQGFIKLAKVGTRTRHPFRKCAVSHRTAQGAFCRFERTSPWCRSSLVASPVLPNTQLLDGQSSLFCHGCPPVQPPSRNRAGEKLCHVFFLP